MSYRLRMRDNNNTIRIQSRDLSILLWLQRVCVACKSYTTLSLHPMKVNAEYMCLLIIFSVEQLAGHYVNYLATHDVARHDTYTASAQLAPALAYWHLHDHATVHIPSYYTPSHAY